MMSDRNFTLMLITLALVVIMVSHSIFLLMIIKLVFRCYLKLYDSPSKSSAEEDNDMSKLAPSQKKKLRQKQKKAEARAKKVFCISPDL